MQRTNEFWSLTAVTFCTFFDRFLFIWRGWRLQARWFTAVSASCSGGVTDSQLVQLERGCEPDRPMRICRCACRSLLSWANERCWYWLLTPIIKQNFNINFVALSGLKHTVTVNAWCSLASSPSSDWLKGGFLFRTVSHSSPPQTRSCAPRRRSSKLLTQRGDAFISSIVREKKNMQRPVYVFFRERKGGGVFVSAGWMLSLLDCFLRLHGAGVAFMRRFVGCAQLSGTYFVLLLHNSAFYFTQSPF